MREREGKSGKQSSHRWTFLLTTHIHTYKHTHKHTPTSNRLISIGHAKRPPTPHRHAGLHHPKRCPLRKDLQFEGSCEGVCVCECLSYVILPCGGEEGVAVEEEEDVACVCMCVCVCVCVCVKVEEVVVEGLIAT